MQSDTFSKLTQIWARLSNSSKEYREQFVRSEIVSNVAAQVFALREKNGMTQSDLALKSGMAQTRISVIENGTNDNFTVGTLSKIAAAFDVAVVVRFVPFSELANWVCGATEQLLAPQKFDEDSMDAQGRFAFPHSSGGGYAFLKEKLDKLDAPYRPWSESPEYEVAELEQGVWCTGPVASSNQSGPSRPNSLAGPPDQGGTNPQEYPAIRKMKRASIQCARCK